jgi:hypothetical protein
MHMQPVMAASCAWLQANASGMLADCLCSNQRCIPFAVQSECSKGFTKQNILAWVPLVDDESNRLVDACAMS